MWCDFRCISLISPLHCPPSLKIGNGEFESWWLWKFMKVKSKMRLWQHVSKIRSHRPPNASEKRKRWNKVKVKVYWMWKMRQMWYKERKKVHKSESILTAKVKVSERWARQMRCDSRSISPISTLDHPYAAARLHKLRQPISALHTGPKSL